MLNLGYEIALPLGVNLHPQGEPALAVGVDTNRAALPMGVDTDRVALPVGVKI